MGLALWFVSGAAAFLSARIIPFLRDGRWLTEMILSVLASFLLGVLATALDFGGWRELEWRAALFIFFGTFAALGLFRFARR